MNLYAQGLTLSLMGMLVTFASLGLFILVIIVLQRLFSPAAPAEPAAHPSPENVSFPGASTDDPQLAAAIAVAIALQSDRNQPNSIGAALTEGRGRWWGRHDDQPSDQQPRHHGWRPT